MASLQDFFGGMPLTPDALQALVNTVENLVERSSRTVWQRRAGGNTVKKDTFDGDDVLTIAVYRELDNRRVTSSDTDENIEINYPVNFAKPPVVIAIPHAKKPLMCSVFGVSTTGCTVSLRSVGSIDNAIDIAAVSYIAIGPKARS